MLYLMEPSCVVSPDSRLKTTIEVLLKLTMIPSLEPSRNSNWPLSPQYPNVTPAILPELNPIRDRESYFG